MLKQKLNVSITMVTNKNELCALCPVDSSQHFHLNKTCKRGNLTKGIPQWRDDNEDTAAV